MTWNWTHSGFYFTNWCTERLNDLPKVIWPIKWPSRALNNACLPLDSVPLTIILYLHHNPESLTSGSLQSITLQCLSPCSLAICWVSFNLLQNLLLQLWAYEVFFIGLLSTLVYQFARCLYNDENFSPDKIFTFWFQFLFHLF